VDISVIKSELQSQSFTNSSIDACISIANNKKLIEAPDRITFEEDEDGLYGLVPSAFRLNTTGAYYLRIWISSFSYLDAICVAALADAHPLQQRQMIVPAEPIT
jgi:hypothetical protein